MKLLAGITLALVVGSLVVAAPKGSPDSGHSDSFKLGAAVPMWVVNTPELDNKIDEANLTIVLRTIELATAILRRQAGSHNLLNAATPGRIAKVTIKPVYSEDLVFPVQPNNGHKTLFPKPTDAEIYLLVDRVILDGTAVRADRLARTVAALSHAILFEAQLVNVGASQGWAPDKIVRYMLQALLEEHHTLTAAAGINGYPFFHPDRVILTLHMAGLEARQQALERLKACPLETILNDLRRNIELPQE